MQIIAITHQLNTPLDKYLLFIKSLIAAQVDWIQIRGKTCGASAPLELAIQVKNLLQNTTTKLMINDDLYLAKQVDADGLHLGQSDISVPIARRSWDKVLGISVETIEQVKAANNYDVDYIAASAVFPTNSKQSIKNLWGLEGLMRIKRHTKHQVFGIGGIKIDNIPQLMSVGINGIAMIEALHSSSNPYTYILKIKNLIKEQYD